MSVTGRQRRDTLCGHLDRDSLTECLSDHRISRPADFQLDNFCMNPSHKRCPYYNESGLASAMILNLLQGHTVSY